MSITTYTLKDGTVRYRVVNYMGRGMDGGYERRSKTCATLKEAKAAELDMQVARHGLGGRSNRITLADFVERHYLPVKRTVLRANTLSGYMRDLRRILPVLGARPIGEIDRMQVQMLLSACPSRGVAENTRDTLRAVLSEAAQLDLLVRNPASGRFSLPNRIQPEKEEVTWVSDIQEHARIIDAACGKQAERLLVLGLCLGLRKGEVLGLDWDGVDLGRRELRVYQTYTQTDGVCSLTPPKTPASRRTLPLTDVAYRHLARWWDEDCADKVVSIAGQPRPVCRSKGRRMSPRVASSTLERFFKRSPELPRVTCSTMRHSFATAAILGGMNVASLAKWLGHTDVTTTLNRYVRPLQVDLEKDAAMLSALYDVSRCVNAAVKHG